MAPSTGRKSGVVGLRPAHVSSTSRSASPGHTRIALPVSSATPRAVTLQQQRRTSQQKSTNQSVSGPRRAVYGRTEE